MARDFYAETKTLLSVLQPRGEEVRVTLGTRSNGQVYVDIRTWYEGDSGEMLPGKGIAKADGPLWDQIAEALMKRNEGDNNGD